jgi:hypothetical protein
VYLLDQREIPGTEVPDPSSSPANVATGRVTLTSVDAAGGVAWETIITDEMPVPGWGLWATALAVDGAGRIAVATSHYDVTERGPTVAVFRSDGELDWTRDFDDSAFHLYLGAVEDSWVFGADTGDYDTTSIRYLDEAGSTTGEALIEGRQVLLALEGDAQRQAALTSFVYDHGGFLALSHAAPGCVIREEDQHDVGGSNERVSFDLVVQELARHPSDDLIVGGVVGHIPGWLFVDEPADHEVVIVRIVDAVGTQNIRFASDALLAGS